MFFKTKEPRTPLLHLCMKSVVLLIHPSCAIHQSIQQSHKTQILGGGSRIRTHGRLSPPAVFKTAAIVHSAIPPRIKDYFLRCRLLPRPSWPQRLVYSFASLMQLHHWVWNRSPQLNRSASIQSLHKTCYS